MGLINMWIFCFYASIWHNVSVLRMEIWIENQSIKSVFYYFSFCIQTKEFQDYNSERKMYNTNNTWNCHIG